MAALEPLTMDILQNAFYGFCLVLTAITVSHLLVRQLKWFFWIDDE
ncbi:hypothetical protein BECAL_02289 [Bellilinea caldifistulae]|nr:hypothetical protein [Bellilinea caldifistulae]GAP11104.1 hypothetical protein BECAL_02289 [Bellilinea caldifistulae]